MPVDAQGAAGNRRRTVTARQPPGGQDALERLAAWEIARSGAEAAEPHISEMLVSYGWKETDARAKASVLAGDVSGWPDDRLRAVAAEVEERRLDSAAEQTATRPVSPNPDGILVEAFASEVLKDRYLWTAGLGWMMWRKPVWEHAEDEHIREQVRLWAVRKHRAAYKELNDAMRAGADDKTREMLLARVGGWASILMRGRLEALSALARGKVLAKAEDFDSHHDLLNTPSGVVSLRTRAVGPHDPALRFTRVTRARYVPGATHPDWTRALEAVPEDTRDYVQLRYGQAITGHKPPDDVVLVQIGGGENGKTTFVTGVRAALGGGYYVVVSPRVLMADENAHPTEIMELRGARIGVLEETPEDHRLRIARLKMITGEHVTARLIRKDSVTFANTCSVIVNTNYYPAVWEIDHGTWRRLLGLVYPFRFRKPHEELKGTGDKPGDPALRERLAAGDGEAVLAWLVDGAARWYAGEPGDEPGTWKRPPMTLGEPAGRVAADTAEWRSRCDLVWNYISERLAFDKDSHVMSADLLSEINRWLDASGHRTWSAELLASRFGGHPLAAEHGVRKDRRRRTDGGLSRPPGFDAVAPAMRYQAWNGVRFRTTADDMADSAADRGSAGQSGYGTGGTTEPVELLYESNFSGYQGRLSHSSQSFPAAYIRADIRYIRSPAL